MAHRPAQGRNLNVPAATGQPNEIDQYLIAKILASQDATAFGELVRRHQSRVRVFLLRLCRDAALADDLAQDCFLHAWEKLGSYRGTGSFAGWLLRIAWTTFLQSKRSRDRYRAVLDGVAQSGAVPEQTEAVDEVTDLDRLLAVLTRDERAVMILSYACGLSHSEISDATELPVGTVKSIIHRGKLRIRERFEIKDHQHG